MIRTILLTAVAVALHAQVTSLMPPPVVQFFDDNGNPLAGGRICTYAAGTTTPLATFTDSTGGTSNGTSVALGANGEAVNNIWLSPVAYKIVIRASGGDGTCGAGGGTIRKTVDNVYNWGQVLRADLANTTDTAKGDALIGVKSAITGAVATTQHVKNQATVDVKADFGAVCDGSTDDATAFNNAYTAMSAARGKIVVPPGVTCAVSSVTVKPYVLLDLQGSTIQKTGSATTAMFTMPATGSFSHNVAIENGIILGLVGVNHNGIDLQAQVATTGYIRNVHVAHCGGIGIYLKDANVFALENVWAIGNATKNIMVDSSNDVYMINVTAETNNPAVTATYNIEIKDSQNITATNVHGEMMNLIPFFRIDGVAHYALENLYGYYFNSSGAPVTVTTAIDIANGSRGAIRYAQIYANNGTITLTNLLRDNNGGTWNENYPGYAVTKTGFDGLGVIEKYSRQADSVTRWGNDFFNTNSPASDLPNDYWAHWMANGVALFGDTANSSAWITSNIRRKADNTGFDLLDSANSGWIFRMGQGAEYAQIVRSPSAAYAPFTLWQVESTGSGFRTYQQASASQTGNFHEWRNSAGSPVVVIDKDMALFTAARYPQVTSTSASPYTVLATDEIILMDATAGARTVNIPSAATARRQITIKKTDASGNAVTVTPAAGNIDAAATYSLSALNRYVTVVSDGSNWKVIANN